MAGSRRANWAVSIAALICINACGGGTPSPAGPTAPTGPPAVTAVVVTGPATLTRIGEVVQYTAVVRFSDGTTQAQTAASTWTSSDQSVAVAGRSGLVTVVGGGKADITATFEGVAGKVVVDVVPGTPVPLSETSGRIDNAATVADLLSYHQNGLSGSSYRQLGVIARWELPIPVYVDPSTSRANVEQAMAYWRSTTGLSYVIVDANVEPRILVRAGTDGLGTARARGLMDGTYANNRARSGLVVVQPELAHCNFADPVCAVIFEHELGHAIGLFEHVPGGGIMSGGYRASLREINMLVELYRLPHGTQIAADGTWRVVR